MDPLTDVEIQKLEEQGFKEGDLVPGRGVLTPGGTFSQTGEPSFSFESIGKGLEEARLKALEIKKAVEELEKNQITSAQTDAISSSEAIVTGERDTVDQIRSLQGPDDRFEPLRIAHEESLALFEKEMEALEKRREAEIEGINKAFAEQKVETKAAQKREKGTFRTGLVRIGGFLGESASGLGAMRNLATEHKIELKSLESKRLAAISKANAAAEDKDFELARLMVEEVKGFEQEIDDRRNKFFDQTLALTKERRQLSSDARSSLNTIITNFGEIDFETLDETSLGILIDMSMVAGIPLNLLAGPTLKQTTAEAAERQRQISNAISLAGLQLREQTFNLSLAKFEEAEKLTAVDAQRLGLPRTLVGVNENDILAQLKKDEVPSWYFEVLEGKGEIPATQEDLEQRWKGFKSEVLTTTGVTIFGGFSGGGGLAPISEE